MIEKWHLRPATMDDLGEILLVCWQGLAPEEAPDKLAYVLGQANKQRGLAMVATHQDKIIAYGQWLVWQDKGEIADLYVTQTWRNCGIGSALILHLRQDASRYVSIIEIGVMTDNVRALALYQRLGFVEAYIRQMAGEESSIYLQWRNS